MVKNAEPLEQRYLRLSLVIVWLWTAVVSVWELQGQSRGLLFAGGVSDTGVANVLVLAGAALDAILGLWLLLRPTRPAYLLALATMVVMTLVATLLSPYLWLHPLGPLSKNIPIAVVLWLLARKPV
ncbi:DoxX-like family protein [Rhodoferax sp. AJA081-3]|uniref:DoxX-like family protein n=1 Tax=Rhodoferax sp. AJA081-3 TaxID=2752316 RepID=UPI001AE033ED|nr:DoxX-like family protein [Rhodoferax sp. AJA081-3]QTN28322.1 DoxX-like family protein [Rhodoferax sp. AJA081-3]